MPWYNSSPGMKILYIIITITIMFIALDWIRSFIKQDKMTYICTKRLR